MKEVQKVVIVVSVFEDTWWGWLSYYIGINNSYFRKAERDQDLPSPAHFSAKAIDAINEAF